MSLFFSIIIPTYNRGHLMDKTIGTVLEQSFKNYELIVVDDGSTDATEEVVKRIIRQSQAKIQYLKQINSERAVARNTGLKQASGDYILFFDSDDTLYPNHLEVAKTYILDNNSPEFIHLRYDIKNEEGTVIKEGPIIHGFPNKKLILGNFLSCNGIFVRKDIALQNQFNEDRTLSAMEDWELWLRLCSRYPLHYINTVTSSIIDHEERSVVITKKEALINRVELLIHYVTANQAVTKYYKKNMKRFKSSCYSYISLHLALTGKYKKETLLFLTKSILQWPGFILQRRFFAILKHLA